LPQPEIPGISYDGGYAEYMIAPANVLAPIPDELTFEEAAPLLCAGVTTYNALRHSGARAGDLVAVLGIGGLGHLGVQYARQGTARAQTRRDRVHRQRDRRRRAKLNERGGARVILATVASGAAMSPARSAASAST